MKLGEIIKIIESANENDKSSLDRWNILKAQHDRRELINCLKEVLENLNKE